MSICVYCGLPVYVCVYRMRQSIVQSPLLVDCRLSMEEQDER